MKKTVFLSLLVVLAVTILGVIVVQAATPSLSLSGTGGGDLVQVTVNGDANASVFLNYKKINYGWQSQYVGTTNSSGYFSANISTSAYGIMANSSVYVTVNNQQSQSLSWPYGSGSGNLSLSQTNLTMWPGQSMVISAYNSGGSLYLSSNSNSSVATASINGNQITVSASNYGSTQIAICSNWYSSNCATIYVDVQYQGGGWYGGGSVSLSQNSINLGVGQSRNITIYGGSSPYTMYPSGGNIFQATIAGDTLTVVGQNSGSGSLNVCSSGYSGYSKWGCATLTVTVDNYNYWNNNYYYTYSSPVSFSQTNANLSIGQTQSISIYGGTGGSYYYYGNYFVEHNSNSNAVEATISGSTLTVRGLANTAAVVVVCSSTNSCGAVSVVVNP